MLQYAAAVFFLIVTPGPGVLSAAGVGAGFGFRAGLAYLGVLFVGSNMVGLAVDTAFMIRNFSAISVTGASGMNAIWVPIHLAWLAMGVTLRRLDLPPRIQSAINVAMAVSMLAVVALAALAPR